MTETSELILPITYEETVGRVGNDIAKMAEFIVPVTEFEEQIIQVISDIRQSGYILFLYGVPGVGKSTFISSLVWRAHIPIRKILNINASDLSDSDQPDLKLRRLYAKINQIVKEDKKNVSPQNKDKICIIIDYLESVQEEEATSVRAFFRDLNGLLRTSPVLIVGQLQKEKILEKCSNMHLAFQALSFTREFLSWNLQVLQLMIIPKLPRTLLAFLIKVVPIMISNYMTMTLNFFKKNMRINF